MVFSLGGLRRSRAEELHPLLLQSAILSNIEEFQTLHVQNEIIQFSIISLCEQLAHSGFHGFHGLWIETGCAYLQKKHIFQLASAVINQFPANSEICLSVIRILFAMNQFGERFIASWM